MLEGSSQLTHRVMFGYFRLALVTGMIDIPAVIAWADREILQMETPTPDVVELSLSGRLQYSQLIGLLNTLQEPPDYDLPPKLLLARALEILESGHSQAPRMIQGLRLLIAEPRLHQEIRIQLNQLDQLLDAFHQGAIPLETLNQALASFLEPFRPFILLPA